MTTEDASADPATSRTVKAYQRKGEMIKPGELIELRQDRVLSLLERRIFNMLLANSFGPEMIEDGRVFSMSYADLRGNHNNNARVKGALARLQKTLLYIQFGKHRERSVQLLGGVDTIYDNARQPIGINYELDRTLRMVLQDSEIYARLEITVLNSFRTKYGMTLYEMVAKRVNLQHVHYEDFTIDDLRTYMGVPEGKLKHVGAFRAKALEPAVQEVNTLAPFSCSLEISERSGRKIEKMRLRWWWKSIEEKKAQWAALAALAEAAMDEDDEEDVIA